MTQEGYPNCSTRREAWDTLCLMQTNSLFAANVIKMFVTKRLAKNKVTWAEWRRALRSPFATTAQQLIGADVVLSDAALDVSDRLFVALAIELPRVNSTFIGKESDRRSCWEVAILVPPPEKQSEFYASNVGARCYMLDSYVEDKFDALSYSPLFFNLVQERAFSESLIHQYCSSLDYDVHYCPKN